jgi:hypothetical protein
VNGEIVCLIESASKGAPRVKRHRDDGVGPGEHLRGSGRHESRERRRERSTAAVLEDVDDVAQRAVVAPGASSQRESRGAFLTTSAE